MEEKENDELKKVNIYYKDLKKWHNFASQEIITRLTNRFQQCTPSIKDKALTDTFIRMYLVVGSIIKLNHFKDFHVLAGVTRTIFELDIDIHLLDKEKIDNGFEKFAEFTEANKFTTAKARKKWAEKHDFPFDEKFPIQAHYLQKMGSERTPQKIQRLWHSTRCPFHWSGLKIQERVVKLGSDFIEKYISLYDLGNWYVHPGPLEQALKNGTLTNKICGFAYSGAVEMFCECCKICVNHFNFAVDYTTLIDE